MMEKEQISYGITSPRVVHVIPGNSENRLVIDIVSGSSSKPKIVSLDEPDVFVKRACEFIGVVHETLGMNLCSHMFQKQIRVINLLRILKPSVVYLHSYFVYKQFALASLFFQSKHIFIPVRHHNNLHRLQNKKRTVFFESLLSLVYTNWIAVSQEVKRTMLISRLKPRRIELIYNGVRPSYKSSLLPKVRQDIRIVSAGRISWEKNYFTQIRIASELKRKGIEFSWTIFGEGPRDLLFELKAQAELLEISENLEFAGYNSDFQSKLSNYDLLVHTSLDEACPLVILEALSSGTYIVSSNAGGCQELLIDYYKTFNPLDVQGFTEAILRFYHDSHSHKLLAYYNSLNAAGRFSVQKMSTSYEEFAKRVVNESE